ncbi:MAG: PD40 domain-containing protein [Acidobacteria bacterium]|nr:PD40 domain-containing protein [Acidobacteriota bacterium]
MTPFLATDAIEAHPAWSAGGSLIAYVSDAAGNDDIWICDPSGSNPINLTAAHGGTDSMPAWAPDGTRLAFFSDRDGGGIDTMNALGSDVRRVLPVKPGVLYTFSLTWSRNGALLYTNFDNAGRKHVYRVEASGASPACLTCDVPTTDGGRSSELSADGSLLLYKSSEIGARERSSSGISRLASSLACWTRRTCRAGRPTAGGSSSSHPATARLTCGSSTLTRRLARAQASRND